MRKRFMNISKTPQDIWMGGSTLGNKVKVVPGSTVVITTKEEEEYLRKTMVFKEVETIEPSSKVEDKPEEIKNGKRSFKP